MQGWAFGAVRYSDAYGHAVFAPYGGTMPTVEEAKVMGGIESAYAGGDLYGGVGFGCNGGGQTLFVKRLVFLQGKS
jgi:hypothetical protein